MGIISPSRGLSLRFPRFIRVREDKSIDEASTPEFLAKMWRDQERRGKDTTGVDDGELIDADMSESSGEEDDHTDGNNE